MGQAHLNPQSLFSLNGTYQAEKTSNPRHSIVISMAARLYILDLLGCLRGCLKMLLRAGRSDAVSIAGSGVMSIIILINRMSPFPNAFPKALTKVRQFFIPKEKNKNAKDN